MARLKLAVLISGRGSNLQALIDACADAGYPAEIVLVISNKEDAQGLSRAQAAGIATLTISHRDHDTREEFDAAISAVLGEAGADLVCLAGFMRILGEAFVERWRDRLINVHPSLLPAFKGLNTQARAVDAGVRISGCTVHYVRPAMDDGPIIVQAAVPVLAGDDEAALAARILVAEHKAYPLAVRLIAEGRARVVNERVVIDGAADIEGLMLNPPDPTAERQGPFELFQHRTN
ncbi:MAG TPA: phosphoribosylglycinamide formyltransferase [Alphaproteobacteria bacterium]|nr:phosphoribosylglycinamide formyltransferase [Alphaproteobacteria bacterium]